MNKFLTTFFLSLVVVVLLWLPTAALVQSAPPTPSAATPSAPATTVSDNWGCDALKAQIAANGGGRAGQLPSYCTETSVYNRIVYWLYYIVGIGAVVMLIYGGYVYMTASSSEAQIKKGKNILIYTTVGIAVAVIATTLVTILINLVVDNKLF